MPRQRETYKNKPATCRICKETCGLLVSRTDRGLKIRGNPDHPISRGYACFRGLNFGHVQDSPDRLSTPLVKTKSGWNPIDFVDAMDLLAEKLLSAKQDHGPQSIGIYKGESLKHQETTAYLRHLCHGIGSPNYLSVGSICHQSLALGHGLTYGGIPVPDFGRAKSLVIWGENPAHSFQRLFMEIKAAKREGLKIIAIDPALSASAEIADVHVRIRPGGDGFLALALIKNLAESGGLAPDPDTSTGWETMRDMLAGCSLSDMLSQAGVGDEDFRKITDALTAHSPTWFETGLGLELQPSGVQAIRAIACLQALVNPDAKTPRPWGKLPPMPGSDKYPQMATPIGHDAFPVFSSKIREAQAMKLPDAILEDTPYPVRAMFIAGANPMMTFPDPDRFGKALASLDFLAVFDLFMTETARAADLVLPATTHLESLELHDYVSLDRPYLGLVYPVEEHPGARQLWEVIFELAKRLGLEALFPWADNKQAISERLAAGGVDFRDLATSPSLTVRYPEVPDKPDSWNTPDGKVQFFSETLKSAGQAGMPCPECFEPPLKNDEEYPFYLSTGDRIPYYHHSQFHHIPEYSRKAPEPFLEAHPAAGASLGLKSGDLVTLSTPFGFLEIPIRFSEALREEGLRLGHGWNRANANLLGDFEHLDPISGFPWLRAMPASISKKESR